MDGMKLLQAFAVFAGIGSEIVELFAAQHPELIAPPDPRTPEPIPDGDIDADVRRRILAGKL